jgi:uncharacterized protein YjiS (DUF1127 family)
MQGTIADHLWPAAAGGWLATLRRLLDDRHARRELAALDDHVLRDIGLTRGDVERELARPLTTPIDWEALEQQRRANARRGVARWWWNG